ncbi:hypothetical protein A2U01_0081320, partial [Trifolium medium]|nr:hypothetical protein [Trifolium medium]
MDSDYAEFLKTYDPNEEYAESSKSEVTKEPPKTEKSKKEDPESSESDKDS